MYWLLLIIAVFAIAVIATYGMLVGLWIDRRAGGFYARSITGEDIPENKGDAGSNR